MIALALSIGMPPPEFDRAMSPPSSMASPIGDPAPQRRTVVPRRRIT